MPDDNWTHHIDFTTSDGNFKADLTEFKNYIREAQPLMRYEDVQDLSPKSLVARFKAWLWNKGVYTIRVSKQD
jgi:hypothetical protein